MDAETTDLVSRLRTRFPDAPDERIRRVVEEARQRLADRPIQDFTDVLVERAAVQELRAAAGPA